jgi:subtilisin family serine protease
LAIAFPAAGATRPVASHDSLGWDLEQDGADAAQLMCPSADDAYHPRHLLVRFKPGIARAARLGAHQLAQAQGVLRDYHVVDGLQLVEVSESQLSAALDVYAKHPDVLYAEPDYYVYPTGIPNDSDFGELWGLHNTGQTVNGDSGTAGADIQAVEAWDTWTGSPEFRIAVIDTGVNYTHPDLQANIWTNPGEIPHNGIDDDGNGYVDDVHGYDFYADDSDPKDEHGHGSHCAGTIGAVGDNGLGVAGINWQCKIVALRFLGAG